MYGDVQKRTQPTLSPQINTTPNSQSVTYHHYDTMRKLPFNIALNTSQVVTIWERKKQYHSFNPYQQVEINLCKAKEAYYWFQGCNLNEEINA